MKKNGFPWWLLAITLLVVAGVAGMYVWEQQKTHESATSGSIVPDSKEPTSSLVEQTTKIEQSQSGSELTKPERVNPPPVSVVEHTSEPDVKPEPAFSFALPELMESDQPLLKIVAEKMGPKWAALFVDEAIIERTVAVVDNLTREELNTQQLPFKHPAGRYRVIEADGVLYPSNANIARYQPYIDLLNSWTPQQWLAFYQHLYPLLQQAHTALGYPDSAFHDKLLTVIDILLETPDAPTAPQLIQPHVFYQYANKELESASESARFMMRLGPSAQQQLKRWLQQVRVPLQHWQPE